MAIMTRTADLLQRAVEGGSVHPRVADLMPTARAVRSVHVGCGPDPDFVAALGRRLDAEATARVVSPVGAGLAPSTRSDRHRRPAPRPVILIVGRGTPRLLAGIAASALLLGGIVGTASRSALPGQALYPVKQVLDSAAVTLASSDLDKGSTLLRQAEDHVDEASQLSSKGAPSTQDLNLALADAIDDVNQAHAKLQAAFAETGDPRALLAIQDFSARVAPQVEALRGRVPAESLSLLSSLRSLLGALATGSAQQLASCQSCGPAAETARQSQVRTPTEATTSPAALPALETRDASGAAASSGAAGFATAPDSPSAFQSGPPAATPAAPPAGGSKPRLPLPVASAGGGGGGASLPQPLPVLPLPAPRPSSAVPSSPVSPAPQGPLTSVQPTPTAGLTCIAGICVPLSLR